MRRADRAAAAGGTEHEGARFEALHEQLALLHVVDRYFVGLRERLPFMRWFVRLQRGGGDEFGTRVQQGAANGVPYLVQTLGRFACVVPSRGAHEPHTVVTCADALGARAHMSISLTRARARTEALVVWARAVLERHGGVLHGGVHCAPALSAMLRGDAT